MVMLDNFTRSELDTACKTLKEKYGEKAGAAGEGGVIGKRKFLIEVSGGVTPDNFEELAHPGEFTILYIRCYVRMGWISLCKYVPS